MVESGVCFRLREPIRRGVETSISDSLYLLLPVLNGAHLRYVMAGKVTITLSPNESLLCLEAVIFPWSSNCPRTSL